VIFVSVRVELDFEHDVERGLCSFCQRKVSLSNGFLELYSANSGRLWYPSGWRQICVLSHVDCGPDTGYAIELNRLLSNVSSKHGWLEHIGEKQWSSKTYIAGIRRAAELARSLVEARATRRTKRPSRAKGGAK
jgi:hypothetical protein